MAADPREAAVVRLRRLARLEVTELSTADGARYRTGDPTMLRSARHATEEVGRLLAGAQGPGGVARCLEAEVCLAVLEHVLPPVHPLNLSHEDFWDPRRLRAGDLPPPRVLGVPPSSPLPGTLWDDTVGGGRWGWDPVAGGWLPVKRAGA